MNTATQVGAVSDPDLSAAEVEVRPNPRNVAIDAMTARMEKAREDELADAMNEDPGLADTQQRINSDMEASNLRAEKEGLLVRDPNAQIEPGLASQEPMHQPAAVVPDKIPEDLQNDPLAEYIVMENGQPMFSTKVDGQTTLIPLDQARRELQIGSAAAIRMNEATVLRQSLDVRERKLVAGEAALNARMDTATAQPTPSVSRTDVTDEDLLEEAEGIFNTAFSGTEKDAAKKLANTLAKIRDSATPVAQVQVNPEAIVREATTAAVATIRGDDRKKDVLTGYEKFKEDYPEIMKDPVLYNMADNMTDEIAKENPSWDISQVMDEAGKRTNSWVNNLKGIEDDLDPEVQVTDEAASLSTQTRQERKSQLVRMPQTAVTAIHQDSSDEPEIEQTPMEALAELKQSRGQPG